MQAWVYNLRDTDVSCWTVKIPSIFNQHEKVKCWRSKPYSDNHGEDFSTIILYFHWKCSGILEGMSLRPACFPPPNKTVLGPLGFNIWLLVPEALSSEEPSVSLWPKHTVKNVKWNSLRYEVMSTSFFNTYLCTVIFEDYIPGLYPLHWFAPRKKLQYGRQQTIQNIQNRTKSQCTFSRSRIKVSGYFQCALSAYLLHWFLWGSRLNHSCEKLSEKKSLL